MWRWKCMTVVCKVCGLTLLLWVRTSWMWSDSVFFEVPPLASDALLTTFHPLLKNMLQTIGHFEISCLRASFSWLEKTRNHMRRDLNWILCLAWKKWISGTQLEHPPYSPDLVSCNFWAFPTMKRGIQGKKFRSDQRSAACFREVGGMLWEVHHLPREVLQKKRLSPHFYKVPTWSNKVSLQTLQMAVISIVWQRPTVN
jgi:hypothetical protein